MHLMLTSSLPALARTAIAAAGGGQSAVTRGRRVLIH